MRVCNNRSCGGWGDQYYTNCRENITHSCKSYLTTKRMICANTMCGQYDHDEANHCDCFIRITPNCCKDYKSVKPKQEIKEMNNEFESALSASKAGTLTTKIATLTESAKSTATRAKTTVVRVKVGRIAIAAIKSALRRTPGIPAQAKVLLDSDYADIIIGAVVPIVVPMITKSEKAIRVSEDVAIAGGVAIADKLGFIDDFVARVMSQVQDSVSPEEMADSKEK